MNRRGQRVRSRSPRGTTTLKEGGTSKKSDMKPIHDLHARILDESLFSPLPPMLVVVLCALGAAAFLYAAIISKLMPATGIWWLDAIRDDLYYCFLIPLMAPVSIFFLIWNWYGKKLFRHN
ncbi:hypothetical protein AMAG_18358 [Allomyces macrogynus ATCC 38327]|uniref:Phosphatidylinositol N-acetylglucosaminyltransferase subunit Y n=1 Tax=Allomyces macrogynus (strain ATCC 38327) TaxID=578462 RepID=A0A0L0S616_ALLM3|nr:hypothetical protein AMAG_18358 [Allomyces macrogynus ATCC 38327]|eukprot:KNE57947.1 hypothetical protein AMAG_18358 [Allomyces macrogynus ATCC 38327]